MLLARCKLSSICFAPAVLCVAVFSFLSVVLPVNVRKLPTAFVVELEGRVSRCVPQLVCVNLQRQCDLPLITCRV